MIFLDLKSTIVTEEPFYEKSDLKDTPTSSTEHPEPPRWQGESQLPARVESYRSSMTPPLSDVFFYKPPLVVLLTTKECPCLASVRGDPSIPGGRVVSLLR